jgi:hypothetical protein
VVVVVAGAVGSWSWCVWCCCWCCRRCCGAIGKAKGQLRVLGSPTALRTKIPRTRGHRAGGGQGGGGVVRGPDFFLMEPAKYTLGTALGLEGPETGLLAAPRQNCKAGLWGRSSQAKL